MSIQVNNLSLSIAEKTICKNLNIEFREGEFWAILGVNGVGKSTFLHRLINCQIAEDNIISIDDLDLHQYKHKRKSLAQKVGLLLQEYEYNFPCTVMEAALIGRHPFMSNWQWEDNEDIKIATQALNTTDLSALEHRDINSLSGGEKRRLNIATLLTQNPNYFLLDEPTNHLDLKSQISILEMLKNKFKQENKCGIMVIHDANLANQFCDKALLLYGDGEWQSGDSKDLINVDNLKRLYGCEFQSLNNNDTQYFIPLQEN